MLDSDQVKVVADVNVHSAVSNDFVQLTTEFVNSWATISSAIVRLEKPITFGCYCVGISIVFWSGSIFIESISKLLRREK